MTDPTTCPLRAQRIIGDTTDYICLANHIQCSPNWACDNLLIEKSELVSRLKAFEKAFQHEYREVKHD